MGYRLGVDVGGTFTDLLLFDTSSSAFWRHKTPSTPHDSSEGILNGVTAICEKAGITPGEVEFFLHGTTVATNAVLEGKGSRVGLVTTEGYRHIMQIARSFVPGGLAGWIVWPKPQPLAALEDTVTIKGRMSADGSEIRPIDDAGVRVWNVGVNLDAAASRSLALSPNLQARLRDMISLVGPNVVHAHGWKAASAFATRSLGMVCFITAHHGGIVCPNGMLLIVDEAHTLPLRLLEEIRLITNLCDQGGPRVRLFVGDDRAIEALPPAPVEAARPAWLWPAVGGAVVLLLIVVLALRC